MSKDSPYNIDDSDSEDYGPAPPPSLTKVNEKKVIGPVLPSEMNETKLAELAASYRDTSSEDEEVYGPIPGKVDSIEDRLLIKQRAELLRQGMLNKKKPVREAWMTELPEEKSKLALFGMNARTFSTKAHIEKGDTSVWTETPAEREMKNLEQSEKPEVTDDKIPDTHDEEAAKFVDEYNSKKRPLPLIEIHQSKKRKEEPSNIRRPFNREDDLKVNKFDEAQREVILKKARELDDRFARGNKRFL